VRRVTAPLTALLVVVSFAMPAWAAFDPSQIEFPLDGTHRTTDSFGDCRGTGCSRLHEGVDIMAAKGIPVLAAADGVVDWVPTACCGLGIDHGNGWQTRYIHLNNDTQNVDGSYSDDGKGWGIAPGIVDGSVVTKGQLIGWVGDSGNAEAGASHLHFELRQNGVAIDPYPYLIAAEGAWVGQFSDDENSVHQANIDKIFVEGITRGCNPPLNTRFCPQRNITRGEMAAFIARALQLTDRSAPTVYDDVAGHLFEGVIDQIQTAGIAFGCDADSFCPDRPLERDEMAELLVRAFHYENPQSHDFFTDDGGNPFETSINKLASSGITVGCNPPANDQFCPDRQLTRAEMATFFVRALGL
jgi:hypothetical protein